jgi:hypothetical protein
VIADRLSAAGIGSAALRALFFLFIYNSFFFWQANLNLHLLQNYSISIA